MQNRKIEQECVQKKKKKNLPTVRNAMSYLVLSVRVCFGESGAMLGFRNLLLKNVNCREMEKTAGCVVAF